MRNFFKGYRAMNHLSAIEIITLDKNLTNAIITDYQAMIVILFLIAQDF